MRPRSCELGATVRDIAVPAARRFPTASAPLSHSRWRLLIYSAHRGGISCRSCVRVQQQNDAWLDHNWHEPSQCVARTRPISHTRVSDPCPGLHWPERLGTFLVQVGPARPPPAHLPAAHGCGEGKRPWRLPTAQSGARPDLPECARKQPAGCCASSPHPAPFPSGP